MRVVGSRDDYIAGEDSLASELVGEARPNHPGRCVLARVGEPEADARTRQHCLLMEGSTPRLHSGLQLVAQFGSVRLHLPLAPANKGA